MAARDIRKNFNAFVDGRGYAGQADEFNAPKLALQIKALQKADRNLRSAAAQEQVLGGHFSSMQQALCRAWNLPELMLKLTDEEQASAPRVRNVLLAVNLARHSANGWDDAALPDDFKDIGELLNITPEAVRQRIGLEPMPAREADGQTA